jgi:predicted MPP superfamily phosphohydrolase
MTPQQKQFTRWARHIGLALALIVIIWVVAPVAWLEPNRLEATRATFHLPDLGGGPEGIRVAFITDLHLRRPGRLHRQVIAEVDAFEPDLILLGGDYFTWLTRADTLAAYLGGFTAPGGVYAIQGNWEYKVRITGNRLRGLLAEQGIRLLINEHVTVRTRGASFVLLGLDDPYTGHADFYNTFLHLPEGLPQVLLAHSPEIFRKAQRWGVQLVLSGHTHGGQLDFPFIGPLWLPPGSRQTVDGRFRLGDTELYVSRGVGTSIIPARLRCPPELVLITLRDDSFHRLEAGPGRGLETGEEREATDLPAGEDEDTEGTADPLG